jgi:hypothetical protein
LKRSISSLLILGGGQQTALPITRAERSEGTAQRADSSVLCRYLFEGERRNSGPVACVFNCDTTNVAASINIQECVLVEITGLDNFYSPKFDVQGIGILKIFNLHDLNDLSKNAL